MRKGLIVGGIIVLIGIIFGLTVLSYYNRFVTMSEAYEAAWAQVENQLKRRNDLIPNLVNTVKGYMKHEREIFEHIAEARTKLAGATTIPEKIDANREMGMALGRLLAIFENYPDLKAIEAFNKMMDELAGTENRIAVERMRYNEKVKVYNMTIKRFPGKAFASWFNREPAVYFEVPEAEQVVPVVEFE